MEYSLHYIFPYTSFEFDAKFADERTSQKAVEILTKLTEFPSEKSADLKKNLQLVYFVKYCKYKL